MSFDEIVKHCAKHRLTEDQLEKFCLETGLARNDFYLAFSRHVANAYMQGKLSYDLCDAAINEVVFVFANFSAPKYACDVFYAFDMGEFNHHGDASGENPQEKYTKPMLATLISQDANDQGRSTQ